MILDKTSILDILRDDENDLERHSGEESIFISTKFNDFNRDSQVGNDSIDLRIDNYGYVMSTDYEYINTLSSGDFEKYFIKVELPAKGYLLNPGDLLFIATLERIHLCGNLIGRITGRSVFSRFGISVHCTQDKFSSGINSIAGLQIINNSPVPLKIFPYQKLAQLMIEKTGPNHHPYTNSTFSHEATYTLPKVKPSDREHYDKREQSIILEQIPRRVSGEKKKRKSPLVLTIWQTIVTAILTIAVGWFSSQTDPAGLMWVSIPYVVCSIMFIILMRDWSDER